MNNYTATIESAVSAATQSFAFDGTTYTIVPCRVNCDTEDGFCVTVTEGTLSLPLYTVDGADLLDNARYTTRALAVRPDAFTASRMEYVFHLAARRLGRC